MFGLGLDWQKGAINATETGKSRLTGTVTAKCIKCDATGTL